MNIFLCSEIISVKHDWITSSSWLNQTFNFEDKCLFVFLNEKILNSTKKQLFSGRNRRDIFMTFDPYCRPLLMFNLTLFSLKLVRTNPHCLISIWGLFIWWLDALWLDFLTLQMSFYVLSQLRANIVKRHLQVWVNAVLSFFHSYWGYFCFTFIHWDPFCLV